MVSRIDLGPDGGPYVELDEDAGEFIIRVPQDNVSFDGADLNSVGTASVSALEAESSRTGREPVANVKHFGAQGDDDDDRDAVLDALDELQDGGTLYFPGAGENTTYTMDPVFIETDNIDVWIEAGATVKLKDNEFADQDEADDYRGALNAHGDSDSDRLKNVNFFGGGVIDGNKEGMEFDDDLEMWDVEGVHFEFVENCSVVGLTVVDALGDGIDLDSADDMWIQGNRVKRSDKNGIHVTSVGGGAPGSRRVRLIGNHVSGSGTVNVQSDYPSVTGSTPSGASAFRGSGCTYTNNIFENNMHAVIISEDFGDIEFDNNKFIDNEEDPIIEKPIPGGGIVESKWYGSLEDAIDVANNGDEIQLENKEYDEELTIDKPIAIIGTSRTPGTSVGSNVIAEWTLEDRVTIIGCSFWERGVGRTPITVENERCRLIQVDHMDLTVKEDKCLISQDLLSDVVFEDGTSDGLVDSSIGTDVTDDGDNTVGHIG